MTRGNTPGEPVRFRGRNRRAELVDKVLEGYRFLPDAAVPRVLGAALGRANVALCLHRVLPQTSQLVIDPANLDTLIELVLRSRSDGRPRLTVTFDDGYADAAAYVESRNARYPGVKWLLFVCPEKLTKRSGFRWDAAAERDAPLDVRTENDRSALRDLADDSAFRLMTVDECKQLRRLPNVALGNHTNNHFKHTALSLEDSRFEIEKSRADFEALFGPTPHFAFPFGSPGSEVAPEHAQAAHDLGYDQVWSTEPRPYADGNGEALLVPRFPVVGTWPARKTALYMSIRAARWRLRNR